MATPKHQCKWRKTAAQLEEKLAERDAQLAALSARVNDIEHKMALANKQIIGPKSERMPTPEQEAKKREGKKTGRGGYTNAKKRKENAEALASLPTTVVPHPIAEDDRRCPHCGDDIKPIGAGERSVEYEWVPGRLERRVHLVEVGRCPCKLHYARGPAPTRVQEGCTYGPAFLAKLAIDKCADATPIYRVEKAMRRAGIPISRSTMNDLVLVAADVCEPLWRAALAEVRVDAHVQADETSVRTQTRRERSFVWTFLSKVHTVYVFSASRSGDTPKVVLGGTRGALTIDGYTGYNVVTDVEGRERAGCWSHYPESIVIRRSSSIGLLVPDGTAHGLQITTTVKETDHSDERNASRSDVGRHRLGVFRVRPARRQNAPSTSRFSFMFVARYRPVVATLA